MRQLIFQEVEFRRHKIRVAQDDMALSTDDVAAAFSGNKAWKLDHYLNTEFPGVSKLISYGSAQSNMLYSLSVLARLKGWTFDFYVGHIAGYLKENPNGNYAAALHNGAQIKEVGSCDKTTEQFVLEEVLTKEPDAIYIPEGGRSIEAEAGIKKCAGQIKDWVLTNKIANPKIMLPSGTGVTALFLQKHLPYEVLTCACVGSASYLTEQFLLLERNTSLHPTVLSPPVDEAGVPARYYFGKLHREFYAVWKELLDQTKTEFDLLYDPLGWICFDYYLCSVEHSRKAVNRSNRSYKPDNNYIYLHQGGLSGNKTMLARYLHAGFNGCF